MGVMVSCMSQLIYLQGIGGWVGHRAIVEVLEKESLPPAGIQTHRLSSQ